MPSVQVYIDDRPTTDLPFGKIQMDSLHVWIRIFGIVGSNGTISG